MQLQLSSDAGHIRSYGGCCCAFQVSRDANALLDTILDAGAACGLSEREVLAWVQEHVQVGCVGEPITAGALGSVWCRGRGENWRRDWSTRCLVLQALLSACMHKQPACTHTCEPN